MTSLIALLSWALAAPPAPALAVGGDLPRQGTLGLAELRSLSPESVDVSGKRRARGVRLDRILTHFGFEPGVMGKDVPAPDKRRGWKKVLRATASDGFEAVFSCAELAEGMGPSRAYVIFEIDG